MEIFAIDSFAKPQALDSRSHSGYCATIGFFDGVHLGHRFLLEQVKHYAALDSLQTMAITFSEHPRRVLNQAYQPSLLTTREERISLLSHEGLDACAVLQFSREMASLSAYEFMQKCLVEALGVKTLVIGYDHHFGKKSAEGFLDYQRYGCELGIQVVEARPLTCGDYTVSSSLVRKSLEQGNVVLAAQALGRNYSLHGTVVHGHRVGGEIGFPTANLQPQCSQILVPGIGVYAGWAQVDGETYGAMINIGRRPTLDNGDNVSIEAHLFDFTGNLYEKEITLSFVEKMREEMKFADISALVDQLNCDAAAARRILFL